MEIRLLAASGLRAADDGRKIAGYAAVFNVLSQPLAGFRERIRPGAFRRTLAEGADVRALVNHDPSLILGRTRAGTLRLQEDSRGLHYEIDPPDTTLGRDLLVSLRRGDISQSSFGFRVRDEEKSKQNGELIRELVDVELLDVSVVTYPAYTETSVSVRQALGTDGEVGFYSGGDVAPPPRDDSAPAFSSNRERLRLRVRLARQL